ncbi:MAG: WD40 repeat domain-containing serine/threonine-protein kinase [Cyanobacteria bacterium P01_A01_bin.135]
MDEGDLTTKGLPRLSLAHCLNPACSAVNQTDRGRCQRCGTPLLLAGRYQIEASLGDRTWRGQDAQMQRLCIIQRFSAPPDQLPLLIERLQQIGNHPQLPQLLAVCHQGDRSYGVWQFIEGKALAEAAQPAAEEQVYRLLRRLLPVLCHIHQRGLIHRDIKPKNIICADGQIWLVDFGAALAQAALAEPVPPAGNAEYGAPEQLLGQPTFASDLYSLGLVCVQQLTATPPFDLYQQPDPARWQAYLSKPVSPRLQQLLTRLLRPASQRYRSAAAALSDLRALPPPTPPPVLTPSPWHCTHTLTGHRGEVSALAVDDAQVVSGGSDRTIQVWSWQGQRRHTWQSSWFGKGHRDRISALQITASGDSLLSSSVDGTLCQRSLIDYGQQRSLVSPGWDITAFAATAELLVSGGSSGALLVWDLAQGKVIERWQQHRGPITGVAISPNQQVLLSSSRDGTVRLWELGTARQIGSFSIKAAVTAIAPLRSWSILAVGDERGQLHWWDLLRLQPLRVIPAHKGAVTAVSGSPQRLATGGEDGNIHLWPLPSTAAMIEELQALEQTVTLSHDWCVRAIAFSPDGSRLASGSADETLRLWTKVE